MTDQSAAPSLFDYFAELPDPRIDRCKRHELLDIVVIAICAVICGADTWVEMEEYGRAKESWLKSFLKLPNGIPSHDTFRRVFTRLKPDAFRECFLRWVAGVQQHTHGEVVAIDGKRLRRSFDGAAGTSALHLVSAWATENNLVLGQVAVADKSNEITAIPRLLALLELTGCIVTIDALGCQTAIANQIIEQEADYVLTVKGNHGVLYEEVRDYFVWARRTGWRDIIHSFCEETEKDHGRIETRRCWSVADVEWLSGRAAWRGLQTIACVESQRTVVATGETSVEARYYISSLASDAKQIGRAVRAHWRVENSLHWCLDVAFGEDESRIRKDHAPENFAMLRHLAVNLLKQEKTARVGVKIKRHKAAWDDAYLLKVLTT